MKVIYLNGGEITGKRALHEELAEQLHFPSYYGRNLDALYDLLSIEREHCLFILSDREGFEENLGGYFHGFMHVLRDVGRENDRIAWMMKDEL